MERLAGDDAEALKALHTQAAEWGGWVGTANYHTAFDENPQTAALRMRDPAAVASWIWPVRTYPERMAALLGLEDTVFRDELLLTMARRLAVARAVPIVRDIVEGSERTPAEAGLLVDQIQAQRSSLARRPEVLEALDRFLFHAGLGPRLSEDLPPAAGSLR
jgi:hypothetical protein